MTLPQQVHMDQASDHGAQIATMPRWRSIGLSLERCFSVSH